MITVYREKDIIKMCGKDEKTSECSLKDFFSGKMFSMLNENTIFVYDLQTLALFFLKALNDNDYMDATFYEMSYSENHKLDLGTYKYILSSDNHSFYSISYNRDGHVYNIYEFKNLISADIEDVKKDFEGDYAVAMHRACLSIRSYAERGTTVSSCAYSHWKRSFSHKAFESLFPELTGPAEKICRDAYHGGICMIQKDVAGQKINDGVVLDVNSLYPFIMKTKKLAVGTPHHGFGEVPEEVRNCDKFTYYIRFKAVFEVKEGYIPFVRTRCDKMHWQMERLDSSAYYDREGHRYDYMDAPGNEYVDMWGEVHEDVAPIKVELCMYKPEFELFLEHYNVSDIEYLEYVWFNTRGDIFSGYVDEFYEMKKNAKGKAERRISKIMLNALSGRMSLKKERTNICFGKNAEEYIDSIGTIRHKNIGCSSKGKYTEDFLGDTIAPIIDKKIDVTSRSTTHIQIGAAITSEAMVYIIRKAQKNYNNFLYTDTDSLHLSCGIEDIKDVEIGEELGQFKVEHTFVEAMYIKEKVYYLLESGKIPTVTWAGMPSDCQSMIGLYLLMAKFTKYMRSGYDSIGRPLLYNGCKPYLRVDIMTYIRENWRVWSPASKVYPDEYFNKMADLFEEIADNITWRDNLFKCQFAHKKIYVKSYKNFEISEKNEYYTIDTLLI